MGQRLANSYANRTLAGDSIDVLNRLSQLFVHCTKAVDRRRKSPHDLTVHLRQPLVSLHVIVSDTLLIPIDDDDIEVGGTIREHALYHTAADVDDHLPSGTFNVAERTAFWAFPGGHNLTGGDTLVQVVDRLQLFDGPLTAAVVAGCVHLRLPKERNSPIKPLLEKPYLRWSSLAASRSMTCVGSSSLMSAHTISRSRPSWTSM